MQGQEQLFGGDPEHAARIDDAAALPAVQAWSETEALGFESQSAFCRAFKQSFGVTATELRRHAADDTARAA